MNESRMHDAVIAQCPLIEGADYYRAATGRPFLNRVGLRKVCDLLEFDVPESVVGASAQKLDPTEQDLSSVTLTRNAKGGVQPEVKVYNVNPEYAQQRAAEIFDALCAKYPHTAG